MEAVSRFVIRTETAWSLGKFGSKQAISWVPIGDEIVIGRERIVDLRVASAIGLPADLGAEMGSVFRADPSTRIICPNGCMSPSATMKYARPAQLSQPAGCGYDDTACEYSRVCDGYEFGILTTCPDLHKNSPQIPDVAALLSAGTGTCLECPEDEWVVLAAVRFVEAIGRILAIDNCSCRRIARPFAAVWTKCTSAGLTITKIDPAEMEQDGTYDVVIGGSNFQSGATVELGTWAKITDLDVKTSEIRFHIVISKDARLATKPSWS